MALLPIITVAALIDSINPCAFSILILTIAFLFTLGRGHLNILKIGSLYIAGIFMAYILIGLEILQVLKIFNIPNFMGKFGASLLIAWGIIELLGAVFSGFPIKLQIPRGSHKTMARLMEKGSVPTAFLLGGFVGLCEFPCTGGPYLMVLGLLHDQSTFLNGLAYLLYYNLIFVLPLVIILLIASNKTLLEKVQQWKSKNAKTMRFISSLAMIVLGVIMVLLLL
jgi:cytochrome c biogenesis protein CcdA